MSDKKTRLFGLILVLFSVFTSKKVHAKIVDKAAEKIEKIKRVHGEIFSITKNYRDVHKKKSFALINDELKRIIRRFPAEVQQGWFTTDRFHAFPFVYYVQLLKDEIRSVAKKKNNVEQVICSLEKKMRKRKFKGKEKEIAAELTKAQELKTELEELIVSMADAVDCILETDFYHEEYRLFERHEQMSRLIEASSRPVYCNVRVC